MAGAANMFKICTTSKIVLEICDVNEVLHSDFSGGMLQKKTFGGNVEGVSQKKLCFRSFNFHFGKSLANNFVFTSSTFHGEDVSQQLQLSVSVGGIPTWMITWVGEERDGHIERQREIMIDK